MQDFMENATTSMATVCQTRICFVSSLTEPTGHNYVLEVHVEGPIDPRTGMTINISDLKVLIDRHVLSVLDHRNIDLDVPFFRESRIPSTTVHLISLESRLFLTQQAGELG